MQSALNIVAWASLPFVLRDVLRMIFMLLAGHAIVSPGLSGFSGSAVFVAQILSRVDLFFLWTIILLIIGFGKADGLPRNKAIVGVVAVLLIMLLMQSGLGVLSSNLSGLAVQRPF
jgi:hypothetical protein